MKDNQRLFIHSFLYSFKKPYGMTTIFQLHEGLEGQRMQGSGFQTGGDRALRSS